MAKTFNPKSLKSTAPAKPAPISTMATKSGKKC